jgi:His/Glu/Gln/Arg/opine family amino acid ABC transporter permease subunit
VAAGVLAAAMLVAMATDPVYGRILLTLGRGIGITAFVTVVAFALASALGLVLAVAVLSGSVVLRQAARFYIEVVRGIPILVLLLYVAFVAAPALVEGWNALARPLGLGELRFFLNHLLQHLLRHLHLLQEVVGQIPAVGGAVRLHLRHVPAAEIGNRNGPRIDGREAIAGGHTLVDAGVLRGNVEPDKCEDDQRQAPFEPALMAPHPIKHGHYRSNPSEKSICGR